MDYDKTSKAENKPLKRDRKPVDIHDLLVFKERKTIIDRIFRR